MHFFSCTRKVRILIYAILKFWYDLIRNKDFMTIIFFVIKGEVKRKILLYAFLFSFLFFFFFFFFFFFIGYIHRILNKYSIVHILNEYMQTGCFPNKFSWKTLVREKINALYRNEMLMRITASESVSGIFNGHTRKLYVLGYFVENVHATKVCTFRYSTDWVNVLWKMVFNVS